MQSLSYFLTDPGYGIVEADAREGEAKTLDSMRSRFEMNRLYDVLERSGMPVVVASSIGSFKLSSLGVQGSTNQNGTQFFASDGREAGKKVPTDLKCACIVLHVAAHGTEACILLEEPEGNIREVGIEDLRRTIESGGAECPDLIFLAACKSSELAEEL